jgi:hypothetical protein
MQVSSHVCDMHEIAIGVFVRPLPEVESCSLDVKCEQSATYQWISKQCSPCNVMRCERRKEQMELSMMSEKMNGGMLSNKGICICRPLNSSGIRSAYFQLRLRILG